VRITTRAQGHRAAIEETGAECWLGTPDRLATLRGALENVTIACWMLGTATGSTAELQALHSSRLRFFLGQVIDTTVRGFIYEAGGTSIRSQALDQGAQIARELAELNAIPLAVLTADPADADAWLTDARAAIELLLG